MISGRLCWIATSHSHSIVAGGALRNAPHPETAAKATLFKAEHDQVLAEDPSSLPLWS